MSYKRNIQGLRPWHSKWKSTNVTKAIRVPANLTEEIINYAHKLDDGIDPNQDSIAMQSMSEVEEILKDAIKLKGNEGKKIKEKINQALEVIERSMQ
ncbi:MAG: hypothetical protein J7545_09680 [Roseofilum sp. SBFL]|uniref:hypothetical protein n=1 Tax=unclassified Roseofilum TaxID=2620099 RepID=UPI001B29B10B|nr:MULTISPECIES: hypothetical protein [unclassified Roseofilum]MBP0014810.1 hypothetical protein [Roseofilum sp. SID3]MBP0023190.1 hypothetical protein [Roseofilum sp. SID2]MBP0037661.1 hypothetical protein [Roseofilum sp. SID1]MBP0042229.1 hypothetical protein [Roseofilum sp. SBFL]